MKVGSVGVELPWLVRLHWQMCRQLFKSSLARFVLFTNAYIFIYINRHIRWIARIRLYVCWCYNWCRCFILAGKRWRNLASYRAATIAPRQQTPLNPMSPILLTVQTERKTAREREGKKKCKERHLYALLERPHSFWGRRTVLIRLLNVSMS